MDKIIIKDLEIFAHHGVYAEEKKLGQKFFLSLELFLDLTAAGKNDDLNLTVNYGEICTEVSNIFKSEIFDLIESAAEKVSHFILTKYEKVSRVKLLLKKPAAPIPYALNYVAVEIERSWHTAYIALGSNLGNKESNLKQAIAYIQASDDIKVTKIANTYETKPVGYLDQDNFLNTAIEVKTLLSPRELINFLLNIEKLLKREHIIKWGPRTIDLDVILYDDLVTSEEEIIIPHPRMHERLFVLDPLSNIAPYVVHPLLHKRIIELRDDLTK